MATKKTNLRNLDKLDNILKSNTYDVSEDFLTQRKELLGIVDKKISTLLRRNGADNNKDKTSTLSELKHVIDKTDKIRRRSLNINEENELAKDYDGFRIIHNKDNSIESRIIQLFKQDIDNIFALMPEYRTVCKLIPELDRVIKIMARDIRNPDEFTKKTLKNVYKNPNLRESELKKINNFINTNVIDKYRLEDRTKRWVFNSLKIGAQPVMVMPYSNIISAMKHMFTTDLHLIKSTESAFNKSFEDFNEEELIRAYESHEPAFKRKMFVESYEEYSEEDFDDVFNNKIIDDDTFNRYYNIIRRDLLRSYENKRNNVNGNPKKISELEMSIETIRTDPEDKIKNKAKRELKKVVRELSKTIKVVDKRYAPMYISKDQLSKTKHLSDQSFDKIVGDTFEGKKNLGGDDTKRRKKYGSTTGPSTNVIKDLGIKKKSKILDEILIKEYKPTAIIPITLNSEHIGYYAIEKKELLSELDRGSLSRVVGDTGFMHDGPMGPGLGTGVDTIFDPDKFSTSNVFRSLNLNQVLGSADGMSGGDPETEKVLLLQEIVKKTISSKTNDRSIIDNKNFSDAIISLIYESYIMEKQVEIVYIPVENLIYYSPELDDDGLPVSVLDGTLLFCNMYISSLFSNYMIKNMKASDKEKLMLNMGKTNEIGESIATIDRSFSTKPIMTGSLFNGIEYVLRNSSTYQRYTIPIFDGESLYDIEQMERQNDIDIDDEYTNKLLESIITKIGPPPTLTNDLNESEFSRSILAQHREYKDNVVDKQSTYMQFNTKLLKIITKYELRLLEDNDPLKETNLAYIEANYAAPMFLDISSATESIEQVGSIVEKLVEIFFGDDDDTEILKQKKRVFQEKLYRYFTTNIDWEFVDSIFGNSIDEATTKALNNAKGKIEEEAIGKLTEDDDSGGGW